MVAGSEEDTEQDNRRQQDTEENCDGAQDIEEITEIMQNNKHDARSEQDKDQNMDGEQASETERGSGDADVNMVDATECDKNTKRRPSDNESGTTKKRRIAQTASMYEYDFTMCPFSTQTANNVGRGVMCIECRKVRLLYSSTKLTFRQKSLLDRLDEDYEYSCSSAVTYPGHTLFGKVSY